VVFLEYNSLKNRFADFSYSETGVSKCRAHYKKTVIILLILGTYFSSCKKQYSDVSQSIVPPDVRFTEIGGRLTNSSITINYLFNKEVLFYCEYGTSTGSFTNKTNQFNAVKDSPLEVKLDNLQPDAQYYYRTRYRLRESDTEFTAGTEHSFHTQRPSGSTFTFAIEADPHLDSNSDTASYSLTLKNILSKKPDFMLDLGDTFFSEKQPGVNQSVVTERHVLYRSFFGTVCHSVPLYFAVGNHEGESGWMLDGTSASVPVMASKTRNLYYSNPLPDNFYTGDSKQESFVGLRGNYYSFEWGDALFVVLDPYWYTINKPDWGWTLGAEQYNWFRNVLINSKAKYKFVFCHQLIGGKGNDARGGAEYAHLFEMGGYNPDGTWGFDTNRPGWGKPIHTLMKENNVKVFFHGHDHFYGRQVKDDIIYQEIPQPSNKNITNLSAAAYGYTTGLLLPGRGYLSVTVSPENVKVDYVGTFLPSEETKGQKNGSIITSYTLN
jgi:hypothetical protein